MDASNNRTNLCVIALAAFQEICCPLKIGGICQSLAGYWQDNTSYGKAWVEMKATNPALSVKYYSIRQQTVTASMTGRRRMFSQASHAPDNKNLNERIALTVWNERASWGFLCSVSHRATRMAKDLNAPERIYSLELLERFA